MACFLRDNRGKKARSKANTQTWKQLNEQQIAQVAERVDEALVTKKAGRTYACSGCGSLGSLNEQQIAQAETEPWDPTFGAAGLKPKLDPASLTGSTSGKAGSSKGEGPASDPASQKSPQTTPCVSSLSSSELFDASACT